MRRHKIVYAILACFCGYVCSLPSKATLGPECKVINFDEVDAEHDDVAAKNYLLQKCGITITDVTEATQVVIASDRHMYDGRAVRASSGHNVLTQGYSNDPVSFTLHLPAPVQTVQFTRPKLLAGETGITFPEWTAQALDVNGKNLGEPVGEPLGFGPIYYHDVPAKTFTLKAPGIYAVRFWSNNHHFAAFGAVLIDDLTLDKGDRP